MPFLQQSLFPGLGTGLKCAGLHDLRLGCLAVHNFSKYHEDTETFTLQHRPIPCSEISARSNDDDSLDAMEDSATENSK